MANTHAPTSPLRRRVRPTVLPCRRPSRTSSIAAMALAFVSLGLASFGLVSFGGSGAGALPAPVPTPSAPIVDHGFMTPASDVATELAGTTPAGVAGSAANAAAVARAAKPGPLVPASTSTTTTGAGWALWIVLAVVVVGTTLMLVRRAEREPGRPAGTPAI